MTHALAEFIIPGSPHDRNPEVDEFLGQVYGYFRDKGHARGIALRIMHLITLYFTLIFSSFVLLSVNWRHLFNCPAKTCTIIDPSAFIQAWRRPNFGAVCIILYAILFLVYCIWATAAAFLQILASKRIQRFYESVLRIDDSMLQVASWDAVAARICAVFSGTILDRPPAHSCWTPDDIRKRILGTEDALSQLLYSPYLLAYESSRDESTDMLLPEGIPLCGFTGVSQTPCSDSKRAHAPSAHLTGSPTQNAAIYGTVDELPTVPHGQSTVSDQTHSPTPVHANLSGAPETHHQSETKRPREGSCTRIIRNYVLRKGPGRLLEWNLKLILFALGGKQVEASQLTTETKEDDNSAIRSDANTVPHASRPRYSASSVITPDVIISRCRIFAAINVITLPFALVAMVIMFILGHAEELRGNKLTVGRRVPSTATKAIFRRRGELPHVSEQRFSEATWLATQYFSSFPASPFSIILSSVTFASAAAVAVLLLLSFADGSALTEQHLWDRPLIWYLAVATAALAMSRSFSVTDVDHHNSQSHYFTQSPATVDLHQGPVNATVYLSRIISTLLPDDHTPPSELRMSILRNWSESPASSATRDDVANYLPTRLTDFMQELLLAILVPFVLLLVVSPRAHVLAAALQHRHFDGEEDSGYNQCQSDPSLERKSLEATTGMSTHDASSAMPGAPTIASNAFTSQPPLHYQHKPLHTHHQVPHHGPPPGVGHVVMYNLETNTYPIVGQLPSSEHDQSQVPRILITSILPGHPGAIQALPESISAVHAHSNPNCRFDVQSQAHKHVLQAQSEAISGEQMCYIAYQTHHYQH